MADDKKKKKEQEVPAPEAPKTEAPKTSTASTPKVLGGTATLDSFAKEDAAKKLEDRSPEVLAKEANHDADTQARLDLISSQNDALAAQKQYDAAEVKGVSDLIRLAEHERETMRANDETARKRENAFRYIVGLGDAISGVANLVGTAHGAANQKQEYNAPRLMEKIEQARAQRTQSMDELNTKLDELRGRERDLKTAGSLREAQLRANQAQEQLELRHKQEATAREQAWKQKEYELKQEQFNFRKEQQRADNEYRQAQSRIAQQQWQKQYDLQMLKFKEEQKNDYYNITLKAESFDIPKEKINEANIERIFKMLPEDVRNSVKGEEYTKYESDPEFPGSEPIKTTGYHAPSTAQKLAAISAFADSDINIKNELKRLAGLKTENLDPNNDSNL